MAKFEICQPWKMNRIFDVEEDALKAMIRSGELTENDLIRVKGRPEWRRISEVIVRSNRPKRTPLETLDAPPAVPMSAHFVEDAIRPKSAKERFAEAAEEMEEQEEGEAAGEEEESYPAPMRRSLEVEEYDLTPMVDMTFLLNMFFIMTTAYSLLHSMQIPAPSGNSNAAAVTMTPQAFDEVIQVTITADNQILVEREPVAVDKLASALRQALRDTGRNRLLIAPSVKAYTESLVAVLNAANEVGITKIMIGRGESE